MAITVLMMKTTNNDHNTLHLESEPHQPNPINAEIWTSLWWNPEKDK